PACDVCAHGDDVFVDERGMPAALLCADPVPASRFVRHVHRLEFLSLVHVLGTEPHPGILPHQTLGRTAAGGCGDAILHLHDGGQHHAAAVVSRHVSGGENVRLHAVG